MTRRTTALLLSHPQGASHQSHLSARSAKWRPPKSLMFLPTVIFFATAVYGQSMLGGQQCQKRGQCTLLALDSFVLLVNVKVMIPIGKNQITLIDLASWFRCLFFAAGLIAGIDSVTSAMHVYMLLYDTTKAVTCESCVSEEACVTPRVPGDVVVAVPTNQSIHDFTAAPVACGESKQQLALFGVWR
jgi:hypothetical protein